MPVESCHSLSAWGYFQRAQMWAGDDDDDVFKWAFDGEKATITFTRDGEQHEQTILLGSTPCHFGGSRTWLTCQCRRTVGKLYLPCTIYDHGGRVTAFRCRDCYSLTYLQRQERLHRWTYSYRAERIEQRWFGKVTDDFLFKRKGQHWKTFNRRFEERETAIENENAFFMAGLARYL